MLERGAFARFDYKDVGVAIAVGVFGAITHECKVLAIGAPARAYFIVVSAGKRVQFFRVEVKQVEVGVQPLEVAIAILLKVNTINHDRVGGFILE